MTSTPAERLRSILFGSPSRIIFTGALLILLVAFIAYSSECSSMIFSNPDFYREGLSRMVSVEAFQVYLIAVALTWLFSLRYASNLRSVIVSGAIALLYIVGYIPLFVAVSCVYIDIG